MVHEEDTKKRLIAVLGTFSAMAAYPISLTLGMYIMKAALEMHTIGIILGTIILTIQSLALIPLVAALNSRRYNEAFEALMAVLIIESAVILKLPTQDTYIISLAYLILILSAGIGIIFDFKLIAVSAFILTLYVLSSNLPLLSTIVLLLFVLVRMRYKVICEKAAFLFVISLAISTVASEHFNLAKSSLYFPLAWLALDMLGRNKLSCDYGKNLKNNIRDVLKQYGMIIYSVLGLPPDNISVDLPAIMTSLVLMTSYTLIYSLLDEEERSKNSQT